MRKTYNTAPHGTEVPAQGIWVWQTGKRKGNPSKWNHIYQAGGRRMYEKPQINWVRTDHRPCWDRWFLTTCRQLFCGCSLGSFSIPSSCYMKAGRGLMEAFSGGDNKNLQHTSLGKYPGLKNLTPFMPGLLSLPWVCPGLPVTPSQRGDTFTSRDRVPYWNSQLL